MKKTDEFNSTLLAICKFNKPAPSMKMSSFFKIKLHSYGIRGYRCSGCLKNFNLKTGTIFSSSKLPFKKLFRLVYLLTSTHFSQRDIARRCCVNVATVSRFSMMIKRLK